MTNKNTNWSFKKWLQTQEATSVEDIPSRSNSSNSSSSSSIKKIKPIDKSKNKRLAIKSHIRPVVQPSRTYT